MKASKKIDFKDYRLDFQEPIIMGILNVTPDSFSDGGKYNEIDSAVERAIQMVEEGAQIIDVGGESTRPGAQLVEQQEEINRVIPIIKAISNVVDVPISIDTYKYEVAKQAVAAGATIINDVWGAKKEPKIAEVAAEHRIPIILTHNREKQDYDNFVSETQADLEESISICEQAGVDPSMIILDPGIGFAKTYEQNLEMMRNLDKLVDMGFPVLLGTSRKSMIGIALDLPPAERLEGSLATVCFGLMKGCQMVRVHDIKETSRTIKMMKALLGG